MSLRHPRLSVLRRLGLEVTRLGGGAGVVARPGTPIRVTEVDDRTWVIRREPDRRRIFQEQRVLGHYLGQQHVDWMLRELDINCVLDVGANVGQYAKKLRAGGYAGRIVSFEPVAALADELRRSAKNDPDWQVVQCALGEADEETEINVRPGTMSSLLPTSDFGKSWSKRLRETEVQTIDVRRLDGLFADAVAGIDDPRVYLKLDTQGYDLQAFAGGGECLKQVVGMQSEVACVPIYDHMPRLPEQISTYEAEGFEITGMFPVTRHQSTLRVIEFDVTMVRAEAVRRTD
jgi:FkbM family methyltransferase